MGKRVNTAVWVESRNRWQINVQKDGIRKTFTSSKTGRSGQREANAKADEWLDDNISDTSTKVDKLLDSFTESLKDRVSYGHYRNEESRCRIWIKPKIGNKKISALNEQDLQEIIDKAYKNGLSKKSLIDLRATIFSFLKYCRKKKVTTLYPEDITIPKGARVKQKVILQPEDLVKLFLVDTTRLYKKTQYDDYVNAYRLQVVVGLRPGELLGLEWEDIKDYTIYINRSINIYNEITDGKNENAIRVIKLPKIAKYIIDDQRTRYNGKSVFPPIKEDGYRNRLKNYCKANGLAVVSPYEIRHTFVSIAKSMPEGLVKQLIGHSKNMDTFGTYGHEVIGERQQIADHLDEIFNELMSESDYE